MVATLTQLVANLAPLVKRVSHNGRDYLVAPASLIVPGVLNGSDGAGYYPPEENAKSASSWDGMPLVAYHPLRNGEPVAAQDPEHKEWVWTNSGLGHLRNTRNNGKLTSEAWFDEEMVKNYDQKLPEHVRIHPRLTSNRPIELSTGLMLDKEVKNGVCPRTGKSYEWVARNYKPDHLAVLPDQRGACSNEDGCGIVVNSNPEGINQYTHAAHSAQLKSGTRLGLRHSEKAVAAARAGNHGAAYTHHTEASNEIGDAISQGKLKRTDENAKASFLHAAAAKAHYEKWKVGKKDPIRTVNAESEGRWVTISGTHVLVKDGEIVHGPKELKGGKKADFDFQEDKSHDFEFEEDKSQVEKLREKRHERDLIKKHGLKNNNTENAGKHGNPQHAESGKYLPHGSGTGKGEQHSAAVESHKNVPASQAEEDGEDDGAPLDNCTSMPMTTKNADGWVTLPNGVHVQVKDGEIVKGPKIKTTSKEAADKKLDEDAKSNKTHKFPHGKNILEGKESSSESASFAENSNPEGINQYTGKSHKDDAKSAGVRLGPASKKAFELSKSAKTSEQHKAAAAEHERVASKTGNEYLYSMHQDVAAEHRKMIKNQSGDQTMTLPANERATIVNKLVANCRCSEEDAKVINTLSDAALMSLNAMESDGEQDSAADEEETNSPKKKLPPQFAKNQETTVTVNQADIETALAKSMGFNDVGHMRATLNVAKQVEYQQKESLLKRIVANISDDKKKELTWNALKGKDVTELEIIANAIPAPAPVQDEFFKGRPAAPVFTGANGGFEGTRNAQQDGFVLNADPEMDPQWHLNQKAKATAGSAA